MEKLRLPYYLILTLSLVACLASVQVIPVVKASVSYTGVTKPMEFYLHYLDVPVGVAGLETKYVMNTTRSFRFLTDQEAFGNSFYKPVGLPKIVVDFYLYPNLAGPVTIDGLWQVFMWVNGSAYKPTGFTLQFKEVDLGGAVLWDSGLISPTVTSSIGGYIDVPVHSYNLSAPLTHTFTANTTLLVEVEVNAGSSADTRIWYDSPFYPSKVILPAKDYARPREVRTYAHDNSETDLFYYNLSSEQRIVVVRANVTDPYGGYDIHRVNLTILDPASNPVVDDEDMVLKSGGHLRYSNTFEANWSYPITTQLGNYTVKVSVVDNNGYYRNLTTASFEPFIEHCTHTFTMGIIVYYDPSIRVVDDMDAPLPNAQVYITWPNGSRDVLPRYTSAAGFINLTRVLPANYSFTILWKDVVVKQVTLRLDSDDLYTIKTEVYQLTAKVLEKRGVAVHGAYVMIYTQTGVGYGLAVTDEAGQAVFQLPVGTYNMEAHYSTGYWLNVVTTSVTEQDVTVDSSTSKTLVLTEFPPPIYTTNGFWLLIIAVAISAGAIIYFVFLRRRYALR